MQRGRDSPTGDVQYEGELVKVVKAGGVPQYAFVSCKDVKGDISVTLTEEILALWRGLGVPLESLAWSENRPQVIVSGVHRTSKGWRALTLAPVTPETSDAPKGAK